MTQPENRIHESDLAVVGMACRFPGATNTDEFWQNLRNGVESVQFLSEDELIASGLSPDRVRAPGYVKARASMPGVEMFDAAFFGFSPRDAAIMDPQHRHFLECAYECLENAGHTPRRFRGSIGVFAGSGCNLYLIHHLFSNPDLIDEIGFFQIKHTGNDKDYLATRLSYCLNLTGPSVNVQTACSTSLVAIHSACQSLLAGECDLALAGGVTIDVTLRDGYRYQEGEVLSPDGHCRAFDHRARGTIFGNGVGVVALRRLEDAIRDGNTIHAVVKGSAVNNDGSAKVGYLAPSVEGQYHAVLQALGVADVPAESISYMEAHGTGTIVGDPIEVRALAQAFRTQTDRRQFCGLGSVKTNVGHLDTAAGAASFIKVVESLKHRELPPSLNFEKPNPGIDFAQSPFYVNDQLRAWPNGPGPRRAAVNSLAIGGTNAHVILEEAPAMEPSGSSRPWQLLLLSARSESALARASRNLSSYLRTQANVSLPDVAFTLQDGRAEFEYRSMLVSRDPAEAAGMLEAVSGTASSQCPDEPCDVVFMFTGQGAQHAGMAAELYHSEPTFRDTVDRCAQLLVPEIGVDLARFLFADAARGPEAEVRLRDTVVAQPALFVIEYALAQLWMEWGVRPAALIGHSIGEYVAACLAGVLSLEDALSLVAARGRVMQLAPPGAMLAVRASEAEVSAWLRGTLSLAAVNGPSSCVVSGPGDEIDALEARLSDQDVEHVRLHTSHAFHSAMMDGVLAAFAEAVRRVRLSPPAIPFVSNVTGQWISTNEATSPQYWAAHLRQTVRFADGLATLLSRPNRLLLEVGPGTTLATLARQHPAGAAARAIVASLPRANEMPDQRALLTALGQLWLSGVEIDWTGFSAHERRRRVPLPTYPFERQRCWIDARPRDARPAPAPEPALAGGRQAFEDWFQRPVWTPALPVQGPLVADAFNWLVFDDGSPLGAATCRQLRTRVDGAAGAGASRRLALTEAGNLASLVLRPDARITPGSGEIEIEVRAAGLNFRDVLIALGAYPDAESAVMGSECAGVVVSVGPGVTDFTAGDEVIAIAPGFQHYVVVHSDLVARKPPALSFEDAVTLPVNYMTAHYALCEVGQLAPGERVLIHAAAGGVGLAAVAIAQSRGAEVYATAGSPAKREFLRARGVAHVFDSRSTDFADGVLGATGGEGVDVVLNSLAGEFMARGLAILRPLGRFLEIGKADIYSNHAIGLDPFRKNISFCSIDLEIVREQRPAFYRTRLRQLMEQAAEGLYPPLPRTVFPLRDAPQAFEHMAKARHIGKIVLSVAPLSSSLTVVRAGRGFERVSEDAFTVDMTRQDDYSALLSALVASGRAPDRVVYLWSAPPSSGAAVDDAETRNFVGLLFLAQACADMDTSRPVTLVAVTRGAHDVDGTGAPNPLGALTLGPVMVMPREMAHLSCAGLDLPSVPGTSVDEADAILAETGLTHGDGDRVVAYRSGVRFTRAFEHVRLTRAASPLRDGGVYLISGGLGGLGLAIARYLARVHRARLVLVGRTPLPPRATWDDVVQRGDDARAAVLIRALREIEASGGEVLAVAADVADPGQANAVIEQTLVRFGAPHGVVHAAGHIDDAPILMKTEESARSVLRPKVRGGLVLRDALRDMPLDFFVAFSSVSAIVAPAGQIDYAGANAFLDSLASDVSGQRMIAIDWGAWRDVGMAVRALERQASKRYRRRPVPAGVHPLLESCGSDGSSSTVYSTYALSRGDWVLKEHQLRDGPVILPGTGYLDLIRGALEADGHRTGIELRDVAFRTPFLLAGEERRRLRIALRHDGPAWDVSVTSVADDDAAEGPGSEEEHVRASAVPAASDVPPTRALVEIRSRCRTSTTPRITGGQILTFGPRWQNLKELRLGADEALASLELPREFSSDVAGFKLHPALLDIAASCGLFLVDGYAPDSDSYVPLGCERLVARRPVPASVYVHVRRRPGSGRTQLLTVDLELLDESGDLAVEVHGFTFKKVAPADMRLSVRQPRVEADLPSVPVAAAAPEGSLAAAVRDGIATHEGVEAFLRVLQDGGHAQVVVSPVPLVSPGEDRRDELPSPPAVVDAPRSARDQPEAPAAAGGDDVEVRVLAVLRKALGVGNLSPNDDFFQMGGDSLSAMRVVTQLKNAFSTSLPIGTLFDNPTAAQLTVVLKHQIGQVSVS